MDTTDETKSMQKHSSNSSQGRQKRRPSLFPLRNSAKRKGSFSQSHNLFDPHSADKGERSFGGDYYQTDVSGCTETKSETEFQFKTPRQQSLHSSPKTPRSTPKQFVMDTPFVPFVHQSLTRTVWQSDEVIPEERDDLQRKESQTQYHYNEEDYNKCEEIDKVFQENYSTTAGIDQNLYPQFLPEGQPQDIKAEPVKQQQEQINMNRNLQACYAVSVSVPKSQYPETSQYQNPTLIVKNGITVKSQPTNIANQSQIQHEVYVSKAPIYYHQEQQNIARSRQLSVCNLHTESISPKIRKLGFSYIDCISVRPKIRILQQNGIQAESRILNFSQVCNHQILPIQKQCQLCQTDEKTFGIYNNTDQKIQSVKKSSRQSQTSLSERLKIVAQSYEEKIGITKQYVANEQQTIIERFNFAQQTQQNEKEKKKQFKIKEQVNFSISHNYGENLGNHITRFENYLKNLHESRESEIHQLRNRRPVDKETNTDSIPQQATPNTSSKKSHTKAKVKNVKNFACQYDQKDIGIRPSLKRVSIADKNTVFDIPVYDISTETYEIFEEKKSESKKDEGRTRRSKKNIKLEQDPEQKQDPQQYALAEEGRRKSKRKASKTPVKKKKN